MKKPPQRGGGLLLEGEQKQKLNVMSPLKTFGNGDTTIIDAPGISLFIDHKT